MEFERTVKLKADLIRDVIQEAYEYYRMNKTPKSNGEPIESIEGFIRKRLMPENNEKARLWTEANIREQLTRDTEEREKMRLLLLEQISAAQMPAPKGQ